MEIIEVEPLRPTSVADVVSIIQRLYGGASSSEVQKLQESLQQVQRSPQGWQLADSLLAHEDSNVQFIGALTFTIKLNSDWQILSEADAEELLYKLVGWLVHLMSIRAANVVIRKICATLAVYYLRFPSHLEGSLRHLICCICDRIIRRGEESGCEPTPVLLLKASSAKKTPLLWFSAILVEEIGKVDAKNIKKLYHQKAKSIEPDAVLLIADAIDPGSNSQRASSGDSYDVMFAEEGLRCFGAWVGYSLRAFVDASISLEELKRLTPQVIFWLTYEDEDMFSVACDLIIDIVTSNQRFLAENDVNAIRQALTNDQWGLVRFKDVIDGGLDSDAIAFSRLVISYAEFRIDDLLKNPTIRENEIIMQMMHGLLTCPGYPVAEDEYCTQTFEFWDSFIERLLDFTAEESFPDALVNIATAHAFQAVEEFWHKIRFPPSTVATTWNKETKEGFMSFRKDVADFMETAFPLFSSNMVEKFTTLLINCGENPVWEDIEASLYCLNALSDCITSNSREFEMLAALFNSPLFGALADPTQPIPFNVRQIAVTLVGSYAEFFERSAYYLPHVLNFLFQSITLPELTRTASKSIYNLCDSCREFLTNELPAFITQFELFHSQEHADDFSKEKVLAAIGFVVQAVQEEHKKPDLLNTLLSFIQVDVKKAILVLDQGNVDAAKEIAILSLHCLAALGRSLQTPDEVSSPSPEVHEVWKSEKGLAVQQSILMIIQVCMQRFFEDGEIVDACLGVIKAGFTETIPNPFIFPPEVITDFIIQRGIQSSRIEAIVGIAGTFLCSAPVNNSRIVEALRLLEFVISLIEATNDPQTEPGTSQAILEFLNRLLLSHPSALPAFQPPSRIETLLVFALESLRVREPLVKKAAAKFWSTLLMRPFDDSIKPYIDSIISATGSQLAEKLLWGIGGGAARSEVDTLTEPLKKLVVKTPRAKGWLTQAMSKEGFPSDKLSMEDKRKFVERIMILRGGGGTAQVAKELWLAARGSLFDY